VSLLDVSGVQRRRSSDYDALAHDDTSSLNAAVVVLFSCDVDFAFSQCVGLVHNAVEQKAFRDWDTGAIFETSQARHGGDFDNIRQKLICMEGKANLVHELE
jgi:hypothetical protein